jgi:hypothetical protein
MTSRSGSKGCDFRQARQHRPGSACLVIYVLVMLLANGSRPIGEPVRALDCCAQTVIVRETLTTPEPPTVPGGVAADDLDHYVYLPLVRKQGPFAHGGSKLGLHTQSPNDAYGFVRDVHDAGAHVALVKALDDFGYLRMVKETSPETVTVGRAQAGCVVAVSPSGDPAEAAHDVMVGSGKYRGHLDRWKYEKDVVDYWEVLNEPVPVNPAASAWFAQFYIEAMHIAEANGYKLALFSFSVGVPKWHDWEAIVETGVFARAKEGGHALALHEYGWPTTDVRWGEPTEDQPPYEDRGVLTGRYRYLYRDFLIPRDEVVPLVITESGFDPSIVHEGWDDLWKHRYVENMIWYDTLLREDDYVVGAAMFTLGPTSRWSDWNYEELLWPGNPYGANFLDYIVSLKDE